MNINSGSDYVRNYNLLTVFISHKQLRNSGLECLHAREGKLKEVSAQSTRTAEAKAAEEARRIEDTYWAMHRVQRV